ncbi:hypothetical protein OG339_12850 [Streptosporangium sp. NBC_01495]|uniref:hypothetical protein n=1 Tax=Streptosporangium sp. NBC_01495 TaxID=2903899 RepID=UPI002E2FB380|nr:hypothetical protein [Streptosporangium sp. NBC_01495]
MKRIRRILVAGMTMGCTHADRRGDGSRPQLLSLFCRTRRTRRTCHTTLAQRAIDAKTSEVPELKPLIADVNMAGWVLTADALHTVRESARHLARRSSDLRGRRHRRR